MRADPLREAVERLRRDFPDKSYSWIKRAILRLGDVKELRDGLYLVEGRRELGDWKPLYQVWYSERERRWYCTCYFSTYGSKRRRDICTHVAAVMLYRRYKRALEKLERKNVYVAEGEVECKGRIEANGEVHLRPAAQKADLTFFVYPRYRVLIISDSRRIVVRCNGREVLELEGEEVPMAVALALAEEFRGDASPSNAS